MTNDPAHQPVDDTPLLDDHPDETVAIRRIWQDGRTTADAAAATLRSIADQLSTLQKTVPTPDLPVPDPGAWYETRVPDFPGAPTTVDQTFAALTIHLLVRAMHYEQAGRDLGHALTQLDAADAPDRTRRDLETRIQNAVRDILDTAYQYGDPHTTQSVVEHGHWIPLDQLAALTDSPRPLLLAHTHLTALAEIARTHIPEPELHKLIRQATTD